MANPALIQRAANCNENQAVFGLAISFVDGQSELTVCYQFRIVNNGPMLLSGDSDPSAAELLVRTEPSHEGGLLSWKRYPLARIRCYQPCAWPSQ